MSGPLRIAYMTGEYLRVSPFVFIYREISALRRAGVHVETISVRGVSESECVSPEQKAERETTYVLVPFSIGALAKAHGRLKFTAPSRYLRALRLAWSTRQPGIKGLLYQLAYFLEAGLVAERMRQCGLIHLHNHLGASSCTVAMLAAELGGFTFSCSLHGPDIFFEPYRWRLDAKLKRALFVCCISHFCRSQAMIWTPPERWNRLHIIHCGVEPEVFEPRQHDGAGKRLIFVGRLAAVKGIPILLEAIAHLRDAHPDIELVLAGDGPDRGWIERRSQELGIANRVRVTGYLSQDRVREELRASDIFVMASFAEGVPVVLMEAMATGLPVIATRIAGIAELVDDGESGFLTPPSDTGSLVERIDALLRDPQLRSRMGIAGRQKVEADFDTAKEGGKLRKILDAALNDR
ncbi:MAG: glycosyltransferase [Candidatus Hydrogenedentes bacterium]|nr:glycosyltransferase [Candidatus Hydrogenedentota bacterium]